MLTNFASPWDCIYSAAKLKADPKFPEKNVLGTGPFKFVEHAAGSHWIGERKTKGDVIDEAQTATESAWFVVGYGVHRELGALSAPERRSQLVVDRLAPLFEPSAPILGPGFAEQMLDTEMSRPADAARRIRQLVRIRFRHGDELLDVRNGHRGMHRSE